MERTIITCDRCKEEITTKRKVRFSLMTDMALCFKCSRKVFDFIDERTLKVMTSPAQRNYKKFDGRKVDTEGII